MRAFASRLRIAAWLGWQIEANWADPFVFLVYEVARPLATALILTGMYWAVSGHAAHGGRFIGFYLGNAFHAYVLTIVIGMGWAVVEEREDYETLKYVITSPLGMFACLAGRGAVKGVFATFSMLLTLAVGWWLVGIRWDWSHVRWLPLLVSFALGLLACVYLGFLVAGMALLLPRAAISLNEGLAVTLYLLCGVIFPIDLLPRVLANVAVVLPFTLWYEALRRFLVGHGVSARLGGWSDLQLVGGLALSTAVFSVLAVWAYRRLEWQARSLGRLDQTTLF